MEIEHSITANSIRSVVPRQIEELHNLCGDRSALLNLVTDAIILCSIDGKVEFWNRSAERMYGWLTGATIGRKAVDFLYHAADPRYQTAIAETLDRGQWSGELQLLTRQGKNITVASVSTPAGAPSSILAIDSDITQYKLLERKFLQAQRLENLGTLASGIAHDLNNILTPIVAITELLTLKLTNLDNRTLKLLQILSENSRRGRELIAQILTFARGGDGEQTILQPQHILAEIVQVARQTLPKSIETSLQIESSNLWTLSADATQIHQVLMNLCVNARDAMPDGGELTIMAENIVLGDEYAKLHPHAHGGAYVAITVADTGVGIQPDLLEQIFEPFFTTKEVGKGTGLGLSTVLTIVNNHQGFVDVSSQVGVGTQFRFYLPALERRELEWVKPAVPALTGKGELILIVDDEPSIREILGTTIESYDYHSITASSSQQAIDLYTEHHHSIQTILLDYMMPGGNPNQTISQLHSIDPNVQIIIMSGLSAEEIESHNHGTAVKAFLAKPFSNQDLLHTLRDVLN
jgi:two-component system, cell cycle sensor histidine kinase and response regulator CckA